MKVCTPPIANGPRKGKTATGTSAGWTRHYTAGEPPCPACRQGYTRDRYRRHARNRRPDTPTRVTRLRDVPLVGSKQVVCQTCKTRASANRRLVSGYTIPACNNCQKEAV